MTVDVRVDQLESHVQVLTQRVFRLESQVSAGSGAAAPAAPAARAAVSEAPQPWVPPAPRVRSTPPRIYVTPSRVLAAAGGLVLLLGIGYLLRYAVVQGWLGPQTRVLLALVGSASLAAVGYRLEQRRVTRGVGQICTATASAGAYAAVVAAVVLYSLVPAGIGLVGAAAVAGAAMARGAWTRTPGITALGVGGALASPVLIDAHNGTATLGLLLIVLVGGLAVAVRREWPVITALAVALLTPQLWAIGLDRAPAGVGLGFAVACGTLILAVCVAHGRGRELPAVALPGAIAVFNAASTAVLGYVILAERVVAAGDRPGLYLLAVALVHGAAGVTLCRQYFAPPLGVVLTVTGVLLADAAAFELTGGYAVTVLLGAGVLGAAAALHVPWMRPAARLVTVVQLVALAVHALAFVIGEAPIGSAEAVLLVAALCAGAVALAALAGEGDRDVAIAGGVTLLGLGSVRLLSSEAPLESLLHGPADLGTAIILCIGLGATAMLLGQLAHRRFTVAAVVVANYGVSLAAVAMDPDGLGRVALTGLWAAAGGLALVAGRTRQLPDLRRGGAGLLAAAVSKAALVDTTTLFGSNRAAALLVCGGALVATAVAEARAAGTRDGAPLTP